jgi:hypothetical protein
MLSSPTPVIRRSSAVRGAANSQSHRIMLAVSVCADAGCASGARRSRRAGSLRRLRRPAGRCQSKLLDSTWLISASVAAQGIITLISRLRIVRRRGNAHAAAAAQIPPSSRQHGIAKAASTGGMACTSMLYMSERRSKTSSMVGRSAGSVNHNSFELSPRAAAGIAPGLERKAYPCARIPP